MEQQTRGRTRLKLAVFCVAGLHVLFFCVVLMVGCKKEETATSETPLAPVETAPTNELANTNPGLAPVPGGTNPAMAQAPEAPPPPPPPPAPVNSEYVVAKGDSFYSIAKKNGLKIKDIEAANPNIAPTKLKVGMKLQIPQASSAAPSSAGMASAAPTAEGGDTYTVKSGDSLTKIAHANGITVKALRAANDLKTDRIKVGQKLKLPSRVAAEPAPEAAPASAPVAPPLPAAPAPGPAAPAPVSN
jgi:peptidoglycan endopeptidase LytF